MPVDPVEPLPDLGWSDRPQEQIEVGIVPLPKGLKAWLYRTADTRSDKAAVRSPEDSLVYTSGRPLWVVLDTTDAKAAGSFYGRLFGWDLKNLGSHATASRTFTLNGKEVAGFGEVPDRTPIWVMYVATEDAGATEKKVRDAGGHVIVPVFDVLEAGSMAVFQDPTGAIFGVWEPKQHEGAHIANDTERNAWIWSELNTNDLAKAILFYEEVFGWQVREDPWPVKENQGPRPYIEWQLNGRRIASARALPPKVQSYWATFFKVDDLRAAMNKVDSLGGQLVVGPQDRPYYGPVAEFRDPQGATFKLIAPPVRRGESASRRATLPASTEI